MKKQRLVTIGAFVLHLLLGLLCYRAAAQEECRIYTLDNPGIEAANLFEEKVIMNGKPWYGFWLKTVFIIPGEDILVQFDECATDYKDFPQGFISEEWKYLNGFVERPEAPTYHWSQPIQAAGFASYTIGRFLTGRAEGIATVEAGPRTSQGLHFRSRESHLTRDIGEVFSYGGMSAFVTGTVLYELQLRQYAPRKGFFYNRSFWGTTLRVGSMLGATLVSGYVAAQLGYNGPVNNP